MAEDVLKKHSKAKKITYYLIGLFIFSALIYFGGLKSIKAALRPLFFPLFLSFLSFFLLFLIHSIRWGYVVNKIERRKVCSYFTYFFYVSSTFFATQYLPPVGGDFLLRPSFLNRRNGVPFKKGFLAVFFEKNLDFLFLLIFLIPSIFAIFNILNTWQTLSIIVFLVFVLFFLFIFKNQKLLKILKKIIFLLLLLLNKIPLLKKLVKKTYFEKIDKLEKFSLLAKNSLFILLLLTAIRYLFLITRLYFLAIALKLNIPIYIFFIGIPVAQLTLLLSFTPGALGILEGGWYAVFIMAGISQPEIIAFLIGQRVYSFIFTSLIFLASYLLFGTAKLRLTPDSLKNVS